MRLRDAAQRPEDFVKLDDQMITRIQARIEEEFEEDLEEWSITDPKAPFHDTVMELPRECTHSIIAPCLHVFCTHSLALT